MTDPHEEFFQRQRRADEKNNAFALNLVAHGAAFILDLSSGVTSLIGRAVGEASAYLERRQSADLTDRVESIEARLARYERGATLRISGPRAQLLAMTFDAALREVWNGVGCEEAMATLQLSGDAYGEAAWELNELGLVYADPSAGHPGGVVRTRIREVAVLQVGPSLRPDIDWERDVSKIFISMVRDRVDGQSFQAKTLLERTKIPLPRLCLIVDSLEALGLISGSGPGHPEHGSSYFLELTTHGRRVLRGDASVL